MIEGELFSGQFTFDRLSIHFFSTTFAFWGQSQAISPRKRLEKMNRSIILVIGTPLFSIFPPQGGTTTPTRVTRLYQRSRKYTPESSLLWVQNHCKASTSGNFLSGSFRLNPILHKTLNFYRVGSAMKIGLVKFQPYFHLLTLALYCH